MKTLSVKVSVNGTVDGAHMNVYLYENSPELLIEKRPIVIIAPGGGYRFKSEREADSIATQFLSIGYNAAILYYSVAPAVYPTALRELAFSFKFLKDNAAEFNIDPDKIVVCGFSAGAHLVASFGTGYYRPEVTDYFHVSEDELRPAAMILSYPVITSGEFAHRDSFDALLGPDKDDKEKLSYVSIENRVSEKTVPAFIWHTFEDNCVPLENSLLMADSMRKAGVPFELHVFPNGQHGLSLANHLTMSKYATEFEPEAAQWIELCKTWLLKLIGLN
ncbi:MAG: alpha/beta hydrolase [Lachnospiraceae bacterium]|nr:alpha/beta hydrolase [Lachnospiraceae bacterium]